MRDRLPLHILLLTHTRRMDGFCNQNADQLGSLAGLSFPAVYVGVVECVSDSLSDNADPITGLFIDASCNSRSSHGQYIQSSTEQLQSTLTRPID